MIVGGLNEIAEVEVFLRRVETSYQVQTAPEVQDDPMERAEASRLTSGLLALLAMIGLVVLSIVTLSPPGPVAVTAPADQFSSERAFRHVERIATAVHATGSPAAVDVREYVVSTLTGLGLRVRVQDDIGASEPFAYARVRNVVAVVAGEAPTGKVFLFAHYDSATSSFGASDDGVGVAVLLEVARAVTAGARPANDIVFVITDGEESCLCGAEAFARTDPAAAGGGVLLNFDDRGASGPGIMYRTSPGNAALIAAYGDAVPHPWASSFAVEVNRRLPGDSDFSPLMESGKFTGLDTAHIDGSAVYHTPQDKSEYVDHGSVQHTGANALALSRALAATDLAPLRDSSGPDATYFPALSVLISYPAWLDWPLAGMAIIAVAGLAWLARRQNLTSWPRLAVGFALSLLPLLLGPALAQLLWITLVEIRPGYANMLDPWWPGWFRACAAALVMAFVLAWYGLFRRRVGPWGLLIAGIGVLAVLGVALAVLAPGGSYLATLPGLAGALSCIVAILVKSPLLKLISQVAGAAVGIVILVPIVVALFAAVGLTRAAVPGFVVVLLGLSILPVLEWSYPVSRREQEVDGSSARSTGRRRWWSAAPALLTGLLAGTFLITGLAVDHFDAAHPAPVQLNYIMDTDTGQARWFSTDENPDPWVAQYVTGRPNSHAEFWPLDDDIPTGPAPVANLPAPTVTALSDTVSDGRRTLRLNIVPQRNSGRLWLALPETVPSRVSVAGREVPMAEFADDVFLAFFGAPTNGIIVELESADTDPIKLRVGDNSQGLDGVPGYVARPDGLGLVGADGSDIVTVARTYTL